MDADKGIASYYGYECWTTAPFGKNFDQMSLHLSRACDCATCYVFPDLKRISRKRRPHTMCAAMIILPAQRQDGVLHVHGFIRVPTLAARCGDKAMLIQEQGVGTAIVAPTILADLVMYMRVFALDYNTSFHVAHDHGHATDLVSDRKRRQEKLEYLIKYGLEVRSWDRVDLVPWQCWQRLLKTDRPFHRTVRVPLPKRDARQAPRPTKMLFAEMTHTKGPTESDIENQFAHVRRYLSSLMPK
jgi:hypothetical protein